MEGDIASVPSAGQVRDRRKVGSDQRSRVLAVALPAQRLLFFASTGKTTFT